MDMEGLREAVLDFTDERLLDIYRNQRDDYHDDAFKIFADELSRRGIDPGATAAAQERTETACVAADAAVKHLNREDFVPLPYPFSKADVITANAILRDSKVPYIMDKYTDPAAAAASSVGALGGDNSAIVSAVLFGEHLVVDVAGGLELFAALVYKPALTEAQELIDEHFDVCPTGTRYVPRNADVIERIKTFSLYDLKISDGAAHESVDVDLSEKERKAIVKLAETLIDESEKIEEERDMVVFFYDALETIIDKLNSGESSLTRTEFLAIIEICQIYCEDDRYDPVLNNIASSILDFFLG